MIGRARPMSVGSRLRRRQVRRGQPVAHWELERRSGEAVEVLATIIRSGHERRQRLVVAERTPGGRWSATHVLSPTDEALRMLRRQGAGR